MNKKKNPQHFIALFSNITFYDQNIILSNTESFSWHTH